MDEAHSGHHVPVTVCQNDQIVVERRIRIKIRKGQTKSPSDQTNEVHSAHLNSAYQKCTTGVGVSQYLNFRKSESVL
jgi:hypothetical protein